MSDAVDDLQGAWKRLIRHWEESENNWNDPVRRDFEKRYWTALERETAATLKEAARLAQVMEQVRRSVR